MSNIEANAIVKAQQKLNRARKEFNRVLTHEVKNYRGVPTKNSSWIQRDVHGTFTYRGVEYVK